MKHSMPQLPYTMEALAPHMSQETLEYHYGKHLQTYVDNLNKLITGTPFEDLPLEDIIRKADGGIFNNAAQTWNHTFFFETLTPRQTAMPDKLIQKLMENFGSPEAFKQEFTQKATTLFGSGWVWLTEDTQGKLSILTEPNAGNPLTKGMKPILVLDVWEHAYYIDYRNRRAAFIAAFWNLFVWDNVAFRFVCVCFPFGPPEPLCFSICLDPLAHPYGCIGLRIRLHQPMHIAS